MLHDWDRFPTSGYLSGKKARKAIFLRRRYRDEVNDPSLRPEPLKPKSPRREKRGQSKPR